MEPARSDADRFAPIPLLVFAGLLALFLGADLLIGITDHIPRNQNEGWGAFWADRAMAGESIYPPMDAFIANNYPPLWFYISGWLGAMSGDTIVGGRLIATASVFLTGVWVGAAVRALGGSARWAAAAGAVFVLCAVGLFRSYFTISDPQWLAQAVAAPALVLLLRRPLADISARRLAAVAALLLLAGLIKHNLLALPLAVTLWLAWYDRRRLGIWLGICAAGLAASLALLHGVWGEDLFRGMLQHSRRLALSNLLATARELAGLTPLAAGAVLLAVHRGNEPGPRLALLYAGAATAWCIVQRMGDGVADNAHFDMLIACAVAAGAGVPAAIASGCWRGARAAAVTAAVCLPLAAILAREAQRTPERLRALDQMAAGSERLIADMAARPGRAICETLPLCYWAGKDFEVDIFNYDQRLLTGAAGPERLEALLESGEIRQIVLQKYSLHQTALRSRSPAEVLFYRHYRAGPTNMDRYVLLLPAR